MSISWDDLVRDAGDAAASFEPIPESDYDLEVIDAKPKMTKDNSKKMYEVKSKVVGGAHSGRFIWDNITLTTDNPNALGFFFRKMAAMGLDANYFASQKPSDEQICATLKGRRFRAKIAQRTWNGNVKNEIKQYFSATASALPPSVAPQPAAAPAPAPVAAPAPAPAPAPQPAYEQPAPTPAPAPAPQPVAAQPAPPPAQDPWAQTTPAPVPGDPWAAQPQVQTPPPAPVPVAAPEQPAPPPAPVAPEQPAASAPAPVQQAPAPTPTPVQPQPQDQQAPPMPPQAPSAPF